MQKNLTFSHRNRNKLTRDPALKKAVWGALFAISFSFIFQSQAETLIVVAAFFLFRTINGMPFFSAFLWGGELLVLGAGATLLAETGGDLFPSFFPVYWGAFLCCALIATFFAKRFFILLALLSLMLGAALSGIPSWVSLSLFAGAIGGIFPLTGKEQISSYPF